MRLARLAGVSAELTRASAELKLENEPGLVSKAALVVVARGDVINEARQKIVGFYGANS